MKNNSTQSPNRRFFADLWKDHENRLERRLRELQMRYFPLWKSADEWRVEVNIHLHRSIFGICNRSKKIIGIPPRAFKLYAKAGIDLILLHEMAHAVTWKGHDWKWYRRMIGLSNALEKDGEKEMASFLRMEARVHLDTVLKDKEKQLPPIFKFF